MSLFSISLEVYYISIVRMLLAFGYTMSYVYIPVYLYEVQKLSSGIVGSIMGSATLFGLSGWLPANLLVRKLGEKKLMLYSFSFRSFNFLFLGICIAFHIHYIYIIPLLFLNAFLMGISVSPMESLLLNVTTEDDRNLAFSIHRTGMNLGWAFGPFVGGMLAEWNFSYPFYATFLLTLLSISLIYYKISYQKIQTSHFSFKNMMREYNRFFSNRLFVLFSLNSIQFFIIMSLLITPLSVFLTSHFSISKNNLGKLYLLNGLLVGIFQIPVSLWIRNLYVSIQMGLLLYFMGYISIGILPFTFSSFSVLYISIFWISLGEILSVSAVHTLASFFAKGNLNSDKNDFGFNSLVSSFFGFIRSIGWSMGPVIAGWIQEIFFSSPFLIWLYSSIFALFSMIIYQILFYQFKKLKRSS